MQVTQNLPGGMVLGSDEQFIERHEFVSSWLSFHVKTKVAVTSRRFVGEAPKMFFGIFPVGSTQTTFPLNNIASAGIGTGLKLCRMLIGVVLVLAGLGVIAESPAGIVLLLLGVLAVVSSLQTAIEITNNAGQQVRLPVVSSQRGGARSFISRVNQAIADNH